MPLENRCDFLIVGQGLAGCLLARALGESGASCILVGQTLPLAATPVAAGIMNPVTGKRLAKSWRTETYLPYAKEFYRRLGHDWNETLLHEGRILRFPRNEEELVLFRKRKDDPSFTPFLGEEFAPRHWASHGWKDELGSYEITQVGWVDLEKVASRIRQVFREKGILREEHFDHNELELGSDGVSWRGAVTSCVVFCEGAKVVANPWFKDVPFAPSRGETLDLGGKGHSREVLLQSGIWLMAESKDSLRAGSTYDHDELAGEPTMQARETILDGLSEFLNETPTVVGQRCGVRPSTRDRLPVMGRHPDQPQLALFNGFGSKGATWAPPLAECFAGHLLDGEPLDGEIDLLRFRDVDVS